MPFCKNCGKGLPVDAEFCVNCGTAVEDYAEQNNSVNTNMPEPPAVPAEQSDNGSARRQKLLDNFYLRLKWELKAWSIFSKVYTIFGGVCAGISILSLMVALISWSELSALWGVYAYMFFVYALVTLPIGIIAMVVKNKVRKYMEGLYYDCGPAVTRGESVGMIVFNALFNTVALIFYIINFITIKEHREEFEEIRNLQINAANNNRNTY